MKTLAIFCFALLLPILSEGQRLKFGFTFGANIADNTVKQVVSTKRRLGINAGVRAQLLLSSRLQLHASAIFSQKGSSANRQLDSTQGGIEVDDKIALNYIDFPMLISRYILFIGKVELYPMIGIEPGILLSAYNEVPRMENGQMRLVRTNLLETPTPQYMNTSILIHRRTLGITAGISTQYPLTEHLLLFLDVRYARSLTPVYETVIKGKIGNAGLMFSTGLLF